MTSRCDIEVMESIVRSFNGEEFHTEQLRAAMASVSPYRRVSMTAASTIMRHKRMAERVGKSHVPRRYGGYASVSIWRPLI